MQPITSALCTTFNWMCSYLVVSLTPSLQVANHPYSLYSPVFLAQCSYIYIATPYSPSRTR